mmetsp:Transcript_84787/g.149676  ORF Transcript_84787/g.149676 Transcript_84787/m.149676 type:complete len:219 (+) Transcript_84787:465-1121(+)
MFWYRPIHEFCKLPQNHARIKNKLFKTHHEHRPDFLASFHVQVLLDVSIPNIGRGMEINGVLGMNIYIAPFHYIMPVRRCVCEARRAGLSKRTLKAWSQAVRPMVPRHHLRDWTSRQDHDDAIVCHVICWWSRFCASVPGTLKASVQVTCVADAVLPDHVVTISRRSTRVERFFRPIQVQRLCKKVGATMWRSQEMELFERSSNPLGLVMPRLVRLPD